VRILEESMGELHAIDDDLLSNKVGVVGTIEYI
jgi:hypothetical protein